MTAFVLGAGLGTRLRPLTDTLPKPLVPVIRKPLITFAFDHLIADAGVERFVINTHHRAEAYAAAFPDGTYRGRPLHFRHEPVLLETAGGIKNVADLLPRDEPFWVYNGDILTDLPLAPALAQHRASGALVTLVLRTGQNPDDPCHIAFDPAAGRVRDIRNLLNTGLPTDYLFSGIYLVEPAFLDRIQPATKLSVIPLFLEMLRSGEPLGGIVADAGDWRDLGTRAEYLRVHHDLLLTTESADAVTKPNFPRYDAPDVRWHEPVDPRASLGTTVRLVGASVVGHDAMIGDRTVLEDTLVWPGATVEPGSRLQRCVVRSGQVAAGEHADRDF
jgi:mannose-1-phosphate guanylyltransferase